VLVKAAEDDDAAHTAQNNATRVTAGRRPDIGVYQASITDATPAFRDTTNTIIMVTTMVVIVTDADQRLSNVIQ